MEAYTIYKELETTEDRVKQLDTTNKLEAVDFLGRQSLDDLWLFVVVVQDNCDSSNPDEWEYDATVRADEWIKYYA